MSEQTDWRRARHCNGGNCLEVASYGEGVAIRDSKNPDGPVLFYRRDEFLAFLQGVKEGDFDDLVL
jgi:hypothetical protein